ncbi:mannose-6-phosphate isomerase, class I [Vibrio parahaemolyticus]|uniref:mannose-6-phosphate isomerase, class I n=1 Tax=Vibrio parahaemolyticus TaxID=670 RepID=UPI00112459FD|nr:mannose-6-phosphate isomerase, class I [Vibrio parahaemolyticus]TOZ86885.1 mannose-6-phosphate isomerase, class I [Vibrio parahaemolyticus]
MIYTLKNPIKNFPWGSRTAICDYFGIENPTSDHQAELWMGAHPLASSGISVNGEDVRLCDAIAQNPEYWLGKQAPTSMASLPFLMKILAAEEPLSIQVHPSKSAAEQGFKLENKKAIPLDAASRNYKDDNHKPELVYAVTPYLAMNGFREFECIVRSFDYLNIASIEDIFTPFKSKPCSMSLKAFFSALLSLTGEKKDKAISELISSLKINGSECPEEAALVERFQKLYPHDIGLFSPLFLNVIELKPGEAMFLYAETPHAYIQGLGIEVMANSDNVLRAGLTPKHIDVKELVKNTRFESIPFSELTMKPESLEGREIYPIPVGDFKFDILTPNEGIDISVSSAEILFCVSGSVTVTIDFDSRSIIKGESVVLPASIEKYSVLGEGQLARAYY